MPQEIHPENVEWRYFYRDENGRVKITDDENELPQIEKVAMLTTSLFPSAPEKSATPARMKSVVEDALLNRQANFCIALPYEKGRGDSYYGENTIPSD